jgi:hypothetical protein
LRRASYSHDLLPQPTYERGTANTGGVINNLFARKISTHTTGPTKIKRRSHRCPSSPEALTRPRETQ